MKSRRIGFGAILAVVIVMLQSGLSAQALPGMTGLGHDSNGRYFAILEGIGLVVEGATIEIDTPEAVTKLKVVRISESGVDVAVEEVVPKVKPVVEPPVVVPDRAPRPAYELRDPFWPLDYEP